MNAIKLAQDLIKQLPKDHDGRNSWLLNNGTCDESKKLKVLQILEDTGTTPKEKVDYIYHLFNEPPVAPQSPKAPQYPQQQGPQQGPRW